MGKRGRNFIFAEYIAQAIPCTSLPFLTLDAIIVIPTWQMRNWILTWSTDSLASHSQQVRGQDLKPERESASRLPLLCHTASKSNNLFLSFPFWDLTLRNWQQSRWHKPILEDLLAAYHPDSYYIIPTASFSVSFLNFHPQKLRLSPQVLPNDSLKLFYFSCLSSRFPMQDCFPSFFHPDSSALLVVHWTVHSWR